MENKVKKLDLSGKRANQTLKEYVMAQEVFEEILDAIYAGDDDIFRVRLMALMSNQMNSFLSNEVLKMMTDEQFEDFKVFERQVYVLTDFMSIEDILLEYASKDEVMVAGLLEKMPLFFEDFAERYERFSDF